MKPINTLRLSAIATIASASCFFASCGEKKDGEAETNNETPEAEVEKKDTPDILTDELIAQMNIYADTLLAVKDKAGAEAATTKLTTIGDEITAIAGRLDKLETPDEKERNRLDEKMNTASSGLSKKMGQHMGVVMNNQDVASTLMPALMEFGERMAENEKVFQRFGKQKQAPAPAPPAPAPAPPAPAPAAQ